MQPTIYRLIVSDWAPAIEKTVRLIAVPIAAAYMAGLMVGIWIHQLNDAFAALTTGSQAPQQAAPAPALAIVQRCAVAPVVANVARPAPLTDYQRRCLAASAAALDCGDEETAAAYHRVARIMPDQRPIGCSDQMAAAVAAVMGGMSQAAAARRYGVSRSTLRRRLK